MGQALCTCAECGAAVRRDDGPLASPSDAPKRIQFTQGVGAVLSLNLCDDCFSLALTTAQRRLQIEAAQDDERARPPESPEEKQP